MRNRSNNNISEKKYKNHEKNIKNVSLTNHNDNELIRKYEHDIRNFKLLNKEMINNIRNMTNEDKICIIIAMNDVIESLKVIIDL